MRWVWRLALGRVCRYARASVVLAMAQRERRPAGEPSAALSCTCVRMSCGRVCVRVSCGTRRNEKVALSERMASKEAHAYLYSIWAVGARRDDAWSVLGLNAGPWESTPASALELKPPRSAYWSSRCVCAFRVGACAPARVSTAGAARLARGAPGRPGEVVRLRHGCVKRGWALERRTWRGGPKLPQDRSKMRQTPAKESETPTSLKQSQTARGRGAPRATEWPWPSCRTRCPRCAT